MIRHPKLGQRVVINMPASRSGWHGEVGTIEELLGRGLGVLVLLDRGKRIGARRRQLLPAPAGAYGYVELPPRARPRGRPRVCNLESSISNPRRPAP